MFQGKIEASEVVQSLKILGINISEKQAEKILQRSGIILFLRQPYLPRIVNFYIFLFQGGGVKWDYGFEEHLVLGGECCFISLKMLLMERSTGLCFSME